MSLLFKISYGLYVLSACKDGKDNACVINTFAQQTANPERFSITVNKQNLTHDMVLESGRCSVTVLSTDTEFELIKNFGMQSGRAADKFASVKSERGANGILIPIDNTLGHFELTVESVSDLGTHTFFLLSAAASEFTVDKEPLTYNYYQRHIKPKPAPVSDGEETWVCTVCGYVHKGKLPENFICPICKHPASDFERIDNQGKKSAQTAVENKNNFDKKGDKKMAKYVCTVCGYVHEGDNPPAQCPLCKAPAEKFKLQEENKMAWAAEHVIGVAKGVPQDIYDGLKANFEGECSEVGMYLAMSRAAHREGYPEIGLYWEKAAFEEAEHAAKFAELLGEVVSPSTKENLTKRVMAENGATQGKFDLAKRAKEEGLDAIHDTVHEMAKDESRHGKAFEGLLNRYFK